MDNERMLTTRETAERFRTSEHTIRQWLKAGKLRGVRPGGTRLGWRIPESEVTRILGGGPEGKARAAA